MIKELKKIARSSRWISLYRLSKEHSGIHLFNNTQELSDLQLIFLNWLNNYEEIIIDIVNKRTNLQIEDLEDDLRVEAYLYWKSQQKNDINKNEVKHGRR